MQNKKPVADLRVRRTRKLIQRALIELTIEKGFTTITVQDLAERAMVNRATFYRHYTDKYDLLKHYMDEIYEMTTSQEPLPKAAQRMPNEIQPPGGMVQMLEQVRAHADFFRVMLSDQGDPAFAQRIQQYSESRLRTLMPNKPRKSQPNEPPLDLCLSYLSYAGVGGIVWWLQQKQTVSPEQIAQWLNQLAMATFAQVMR